MPKPAGELLLRLGPGVMPFERYNRNNPKSPPKKIFKGEDLPFDKDVFSTTSGGNPPDFIVSSPDNLLPEKRYLWIINEEGLHIIYEHTANLEAGRKIVCHSNITKGEIALQGGELWFLGGNEIIINYKSGRYGAETIAHEKAVVEYFELLGYKVNVQS
jgi:hypothetical protein